MQKHPGSAITKRIMQVLAVLGRGGFSSQSMEKAHRMSIGLYDFCPSPRRHSMSSFCSLIEVMGDSSNLYGLYWPHQLGPTILTANPSPVSLGYRHGGMHCSKRPDRAGGRVESGVTEEQAIGSVCSTVVGSRHRTLKKLINDL